MELWRGIYDDFRESVATERMFPELEQQFRLRYGHLPGESELRSWRASLEAVADAVEIRRADDVGVSVEYHLPLSGQRIDTVFFGRSDDGVAHALVVELKRWSDVDVEDEFAENVIVDQIEHPHPSQQALDYASFLADYHSTFVNGDAFSRSCAFCHNLGATGRRVLEDVRFRRLLKDSPLFGPDDAARLSAFVEAHTAAGGGPAVMDLVSAGRFKPSERVIRRLNEVINQDRRWALLDTQRVAYNTIRAHMKRVRARGGRSAVLVRGGPGTGKTVIAVQLLADALREGFAAVHSSGGKAFTTAMRSTFKGADKLFVWNLSTRSADYQGLDLLLVDEAHRIRETSDTRFTPKKERNKRAQIDELLDAAKVSVFLLDEHQYMRPDEIGESRMIREATANQRIPLKEYDLRTQFRCGGCLEYLQWVDYLLGYRTQLPQPWGSQYRFDIAAVPDELDLVLEEADGNDESARLVAGFGWKWSAPLKGGGLVDDVIVGDWRRPWNAKRDPKKAYKPENDPYTLWAETSAGLDQVGCVYSAQGFEFDRVGVIWANDLVWRDGRWVAQKKLSFDNPVKRSRDMVDLVRNAYRVLLTRGIRHTRLLVLDEETRHHVVKTLADVKAAGNDVRRS